MKVERIFWKLFFNIVCLVLKSFLEFRLKPQFVAKKTDPALSCSVREVLVKGKAQYSSPPCTE